MKKLWRTIAAVAAATWNLVAAPSADLIIVVGAAGTEEYGKAFRTAAEAWEEAGLRPSPTPEPRRVRLDCLLPK